MVRPDLNATAEARVKGLVGLRDCVQELIDLQMDAAVPDSTIREKQAELNSLYDSFSAKYGLINDRANRLAYADDSSYYLLCALEVIDEDGKLERKADMFTNEWPLHVVLYSEHYAGSRSGHRRALSAFGCGHSADRSPLL